MKLQTKIIAGQTAPVEDYKGAKTSQIRLRAFVIGLLLIPPDNYWVILMEKVYRGPYPTVIAIFVNTLFILALIAAVNTLTKRLRPRWALSMAEMLLIYTMITVAAALAGHDMLPTLVATMGYPWLMADSANNWANTFLPAIPKWLSVTDKSVLKPLYEGGSSLYSNGHWLAWLKPSLWWIGFISVVVFVMACINVLVRKQWTEHERLTFPIVQVPLAMTEPKGEIWRSKLFWTGFGACAVIELINGLAVYFPSLPQINLGFENHDLTASLTTNPWKAMWWTPYTFYPFVIGIGYLLPADLCFSTWFFYLFWKMEKIIAATFGMDVPWDGPYIKQQEFGGVIAVVLMLLWNSRGYLRQVWLRILDRESTLDDSDEPMSYRRAAAGALIGFILVSAFMVRIGMSPLVALAAFLIYFMLAAAIARIRAELGPPVHDMPFGPDYIISSTAGLGPLKNGDFVGLSYFAAFHGAYRSHPMPIMIEGMKMAHSTGSSQKKILLGVLLAAPVGAAATFWTYLHLGYSYGLDAKWNYSAAWAWKITKLLQNWWARPPEAMKPDWSANAAMGGGFLFCMFLGWMRMKVFNWPFHPIGYVISGTYQASLVWVPLLIAWAVKVSILHYGGLKVYRNAMPFFLGLIIGQLIMGCLWGIIGITFNIPYYNFFGA